MHVACVSARSSSDSSDKQQAHKRSPHPESLRKKNSVPSSGVDAMLTANEVEVRAPPLKKMAVEPHVTVTSPELAVLWCTENAAWPFKNSCKQATKHHVLQGERVTCGAGTTTQLYASPHSAIPRCLMWVH